MPLGISIYNYEPGYPTVGFIEVTTDANGQASFAFKFPSVGHYGLRLWGGSLGINAVIQDVTITTPVIPVGAITAPKAATPSPTEAPAATSTTPIDNGEQSNGGVSAQTSTAGDARHAETASESVVGDEGATTQGMPGPGIAVVLLTIVALALLMRRGREEENDYEEERPYERERRYRR